MTVQNINKAWDMVNEIFPTDYEKDENASNTAGYNIYRSRLNHYDYICELGDRLEVNLANGKTVNIWIESSEDEASETATAENVTGKAEEIMHEYILTIGLNDRVTEKQEISNEAAKRMISEILINKYGVFAFTMFDCYGVYKMNSTGRIIQEPSIRIEIATFEPMNNIDEIIRVIKDSVHLNQESIMKKYQVSNISFIE